MPESDLLARKEREKFQRKQTNRMKNNAPKDIGNNYHLGHYFDECKPNKAEEDKDYIG